MNIKTSKNLYIVVGVIIVLVGIFWYFPKFSNYIFYLRVPIISGLLLFSFPVLALRFLPSMLGNFFVLNNWLRLATVIPAAIWAGLGIATVGRLIIDNAECRFFAGDCAALVHHPIWPYIVAVILGLPVALASYASSGPDSTDMTVSERDRGAFLGAGVSLFLLLGVYYLNKNQNTILNVRDLLNPILIWLPGPSEGYSNKAGLASGHIEAFWFINVGAVLYVLGLFAYRPRLVRDKWWQQYQAPALFYVIELILIMTLVFGFLTFWLDYYQAPIILLAIAWSMLAYKFWKVEHDYDLKPAPDISTDPGFIAALNKRLQNQADGQKSLVVVCASGGGIQAAGWTAQVLIGLQNELGEDFTKAIGLISSVSGGSVGTLHFLDNISSTGAPNKNDLDKIFDNATSESLSAVGWGLAYPDLWRFIGLPFLKTTPRDRGVAIDTDWKRIMNKNAATLHDWKAAINTGNLPTPVFNATLVEDGRRYLVSPMSFGMGVKEVGGVDFNSLYPKATIDASTAALLSATFPYVSPIMRNTQLGCDDPVFHVADGGFFDNYGVVSAVEWLEKKILPSNNKLGLKRVVIVVVNAFSAIDPLKSGSAQPQGWKMAFFGPILAVINARTSTQIQRDLQEISDLVTFGKSKKVDIQPYMIAFPKQLFFDLPLPTTRFDSVNAVFNSMQEDFKKQKESYQPPLTWMLSKKQKAAIKAGWAELLAENQHANDKEGASSNNYNLKGLQDLIKDWKSVPTK